ncbi:hypothetical protein FH972_025710 [Carpinus fangiana]|uniref:Uncharacterized protein n=1 Tax=Carpinus fangiana TaxID=176857 RepID=A0A5N6L266_9ROSI|nr:hypothetical protein FH972_025710 [Carpinus fangiana]
MDPLTGVQDGGAGLLPIFSMEKVDMQFSVAAEFVAAQVANNVLVLALQTGKVMRIDLDTPEDVDDIDLPKKASEIGIIRKIFLDPTASHLIISTTLGENYYLHAQSRAPKPLSRLKGVTIDSVSWNPSQPTASTREILIGASDGNIFETFLELSSEFYRRDEKYVKAVLRVEGPITGIWTDTIPGKADLRRVLISSPARLFHYIGKIGRHGHEGSGSIFARLFEAETPTVHDVAASQGSMSSIAVTPDAPDMPTMTESANPERIFAWLNAQGTLHGKLLNSPAEPSLGRKVFNEARNLSGPATFVALTQWHILRLVEGRIVAVNRLDESTVYSQSVLDGRQRPIALLADLKKNTFWLFTSQSIYEIVVQDEDRDVWKILLRQQKFEEALQYANSPSQRDAVATASGDYLMKAQKYSEAAGVYGKSSKPFEEVALALIDSGQKDALRKYLLTKLSALKKSATMQRVMVASWLAEVYMSKLNSLDDMVMTGAELEEDKTPKEVDNQLATVRREYQDFVRKYRDDLDKRTIYDIISSHGREEELLFFATAINDHNYVVSYWSQREDWSEALKALNKQTDPEIVYKYSSVLMAHVASAFIEVLMRQSNIDARKLIPAFLNYNTINQSLPLKSNQAVRYLLYEINQRSSSDAAVHNTLISIYASHSSHDESALVAYLESQAPTSLTPTMRLNTDEKLPYDTDFALRLCIQHSRIQACVHIYTTMGRYAAAVDLALQHQQTDLAIAVAERPEHDASTQKKLWLAIARSVISGAPSSLEDATKKQPAPKGLEPKKRKGKTGEDAASISTALTLIRRAPPGVLKIEDVLPLFPDFVRVDAFKDEVCVALASYSAHIDSLKAEMDASAASSARIADETAKLGRRWVLLEPGESCGVCGLALLERRFWVWGCGHGAHGDCAARQVVKHGSKSVALRVREIKAQLDQGSEGKKRTQLVKEMDDIVGRECPLCGDVAIRMVDEPFVTADDDKSAWAL